ncbi:MAG: trehalase family glycosidase [Armatimonadota bacterium]|nr:trehalase family glycosidase [Armatimonadota bacterium]
MRIFIPALIFALLISPAIPSAAAKKASAAKKSPVAKKAPGDLCDLLKDNPIYTGEVGYSDLSSNISIAADNPSGIGSISLDRGGRSRLLGRAPAILEAVVVDNGVEKAAATDGPISCYPHGIRSVRSEANVEAEWFTTFVDTDLVACCLKLTNKGPNDVTLVPRLRGELGGDTDVSIRADFDAARNMIIVTRKETAGPQRQPVFAYIGIMSGFLPHDCRLGESPTDLQKTWSASGSGAAYAMTGASFVVPPGETRKLWAVLSVSLNGRDVMIDAAESKVRWMNSVASVETSSRSRVLKQLRQMPGPGGNPVSRKLYYRSACTMIRNVGGTGGSFGKNRPCFAVRSKSVVTPLDASVLATGLAEIDIKLAREQLLILVENMNENGSMPESISAESVSTAPCVEPPLAAWAAWQVYEHKFDEQFLKQVYDPLCRNTDWWFAEHDRDFDNLCEFAGTLDATPPEQICDSVELSGYVLAQVDSLAKMAAVLGRDIQQRAWKARADAIRQRIASTLYDPASNLLCDASVTKHELRKAIDPGCFVPLWAGLQLPKGAERAMARDYLGNPQYFFGSLPFPDVPYTDERYAGECRITPLTAYLMMGAMRANGRDVKEARERLVRLVANSGGSCEAFDAKTGIGLGAREHAVTAALALRTILGRSDRMDITQPLGNNE